VRAELYFRLCPLVATEVAGLVRAV
jgi:hypothetical protein